MNELIRRQTFGLLASDLPQSFLTNPWGLVLPPKTFCFYSVYAIYVVLTVNTVTEEMEILFLVLMGGVSIRSDLGDEAVDNKNAYCSDWYGDTGGGSNKVNKRGGRLTIGWMSQYRPGYISSRSSRHGSSKAVPRLVNLFISQQKVAWASLNTCQHCVRTHPGSYTHRHSTMEH